MKTKEELQAIYFGFYDQLPEPWRSECKERWDYEFARIRAIPYSFSDATANGFDWSDELAKWHEFYNRILRNEIPLTPNSSFTPTLSDIKKQLDRIEELLNKLTNNK